MHKAFEELSRTLAAQDLQESEDLARSLRLEAQQQQQETSLWRDSQALEDEVRWVHSELQAGQAEHCALMVEMGGARSSRFDGVESEERFPLAEVEFVSSSLRLESEDLLLAERENINQVHGLEEQEACLAADIKRTEDSTAAYRRQAALLLRSQQTQRGKIALLREEISEVRF
ncbi:unnamed protein product [Effrenium voratum]|uniref:Uncharacterized protein n=1 Tax=Effrenium voratum TaxID=2562239 RepID=A0AA36MX92_9DINO|nr:unnamed protein product [Effrenium voratum]